jgi:hypothetical protein
LGTSIADPEILSENIAVLSETSIEPVAEKYCTGTHAQYLYPIFAGKVPAIQVFYRYPCLIRTHDGRRRRGRTYSCIVQAYFSVFRQGVRRGFAMMKKKK